MTEFNQFTHKLAYPITLSDGLLIEEVTFKHRPTGRQMKQSAAKYKTAEERDFFLLSYAIGLPEEATDLMDALDLSEVQNLFLLFIQTKKDGGQ